MWIGNLDDFSFVVMKQVFDKDLERRLKEGRLTEEKIEEYKKAYEDGEQPDFKIKGM